MNPNPFSRKELIVHSADGGKIGKPVVIDIPDHKTHFVTVTGEHNRGLFLSPPPDISEGIAQDVGFHSIHIFLDISPEYPLHGLLIA
jgi:hypothetical protein